MDWWSSRFQIEYFMWVEDHGEYSSYQPLSAEHQHAYDVDDRGRPVVR